MIIRSAASRAEFRPEKMGKANLVAGENIFAGLNCFEPGQEHQLHSHPGQDKIYYVLEGEGDVTVGDTTERIGPGDLVLAVSDEPHALSNPGPGRLVVMALMAPPPSRKR
jgi:quercetin dioxygenase-like cupin family protein